MVARTSTTRSTHRMTADELFRLGDIGRCELIRGELIRMSPSGGRHGDVAATVAYYLKHHVLKHKLGKVYGVETGFILSRDPDTVRAPDAAFIAADRVEEVHTVKFIPGAPDLAVEVLSSDDRPGEVAAKTKQWLEGGAKEVWVVDPAKRTVAIHREGEDAVVRQGSDVITTELLPGFELDVESLFED